MKLSILVISKTAERLSAMLESLAAATELPIGEVEILCSWNGTNDSEEKNYRRSVRVPHCGATNHFSGNMNRLAKHANGDVLAFLNDDLILDNGSLDAGLSCLSTDVSTLCVGALLRTPDGILQHGGMAFDINHTPYHIAEGLAGVTNVISEMPSYDVMRLGHDACAQGTFSQQPFEEATNAAAKTYNSISTCVKNYRAR